MISTLPHHRRIAAAVICGTTAFAAHSANATAYLIGSDPTLNGSGVEQSVVGAGQTAGTGITPGAQVGYTGAFTGTTNPAFGGSVSIKGVFIGPVGATGGFNHEFSSGKALLPSFATTGSPNAGNASWQITYDFSGLQGGVLPAGGSFYLRDFDGNSLISNMTATNGAGSLSTPFFGDPIRFDLSGDANLSGQPNPVDPTDYATVSFNNGAYTIQAPAGFFDLPVLEMLVTQPLKSLTFNWFSPPGVFNDIIFSDTRVSPVPLPSVLGLLGIGAFAMFGATRRRS
jgi:hypothetical protein